MRVLLSLPVLLAVLSMVLEAPAQELLQDSGTLDQTPNKQNATESALKDKTQATEHRVKRTISFGRKWPDRFKPVSKNRSVPKNKSNSGIWKLIKNKLMRPRSNLNFNHRSKPSKIGGRIFKVPDFSNALEDILSNLFVETGKSLIKTQIAKLEEDIIPDEASPNLPPKDSKEQILNELKESGITPGTQQ